jgi:hypothetical protein
LVTVPGPETPFWRGDAISVFSRNIDVADVPPFRTFQKFKLTSDSHFIARNFFKFVATLEKTTAEDSSGTPTGSFALK